MPRARGTRCESYALAQSKKGSFGRCSWSHRFVSWLSAHFGPGSNIKLVSLAQPATTSAWIVSHLDAVMKVRGRGGEGFWSVRKVQLGALESPACF